MAKRSDSLALCNAQLHLQIAYKNFFRDPSFGFSEIQVKKNPVKSYTKQCQWKYPVKRGEAEAPKGRLDPGIRQHQDPGRCLLERCIRLSGS